MKMRMRQAIAAARADTAPYRLPVEDFPADEQRKLFADNARRWYRF